jgi:hypothetical protein
MQLTKREQKALLAMLRQFVSGVDDENSRGVLVMLMRKLEQQ